MGLHDMLAGNRYLTWKQDLVAGGFTVSDQLVSGKHSVLFDDVGRTIAFVSPQFCHYWNYHQVRTVDYRVRAQLGNTVRFELNIMTSDVGQPFGQLFIETSNPSEPDYWVAKILAHCNQR